MRVFSTLARSMQELACISTSSSMTTASGCNANALGVAFYGTQAPASLNNITISGNEIDHLQTGLEQLGVLPAA